MMPFSWDSRISRAERLADDYPASAEILHFYAQVARFQKSIFGRLQSQAGGNLSPASVDSDFPDLLRLIRRIGPPAIAEQATRLESERATYQDVLAAAWNRADDRVEIPETLRFFARALLQPYLECVVMRSGIHAQAEAACCPFCGEKPQAAVLRGEGDGAKRSLLCSLCSSEWAFRRILCPGCGEEQEDKLPVYIAAGFEHVRVEACDSCRTYIKSVDLTKNGLAVPCVDDVAAVPLSLWAEQSGYQRLESNLLGV
jgi:FdhE protein